MVNSLYFRNDVNPPLKPLFCGDEQCAPGHDYGGIRPYIIVHIILSGGGEFLCRRRKWNLRRGEAFVIFPEEKHQYRSNKDDPWHYFWIAMEADMAPYFETRRTSPDNPILKTDRVDDLFARYKELARREARMQPGSDLAFCGLFYDILGELLNGDHPDRWEPTGDVKVNHVRAMNTFINRYFSSNITVSHVADYVHLERSYASRIFKNEMSRGIGEHIRMKRLEKSRDFLTLGLSVKESAYSAGFRMYENYLKLFRRVYGMTPSEYKEQQHEYRVPVSE